MNIEALIDNPQAVSRQVYTDHPGVLADLDRAAYLAILGLYRDWQAGGEQLAAPLATAFAQRSEELEALD